jgi:DNA ligase-3
VNGNIIAVAIRMSLTRYCVEYAASNRAGCRTCKAKIDKGSLRIGTISPGPSGHDQTQWRHLECQKKPKNLGSAQELDNFEVIDPADQEKVRAHFAAGAHPSPLKRSREAVAEDSGLDPKKMKKSELEETVKVRSVPQHGVARPPYGMRTILRRRWRGLA